MLTLHYIPEDERHGELCVEARHAGFCGWSSVWFNADALRQFAEAVRTYPPKLEEPVRIESGYFSHSVVSTAPVETHVGSAGLSASDPEAALAAEQPGAWFDSHALHLLALFQDRLVKSRYEPSTDETFYERLLIHALGLARHPRPSWVGDVVFTDDNPQF